MKQTRFLHTRARSILLLLLAACLLLVSCGGGEVSQDGGTSQGGTSADNGDGSATAYSVTVSTMGGMPLAGVDVYVYDGDDMKDLATTSENGEAAFNLPANDNYSIVLAKLPKGYIAEESYFFVGGYAMIKLASAPIQGEDISTAQLALGNVMYDFTVTTSEGVEMTLSQLLKTKKMVMLNFWHTGCTWCLEEFPLMNQVYADYRDEIEIIALDPYEDNATVQNFKQQHGLDFAMAACPASWANAFGISSYPTTVMIDRFGVICVMEVGAILSKRPFMCAFDHFTAENYKQTICMGGVQDLVTQVEPTFTMESSETIQNAINNGDIPVTYRPETEDENAKYIWPFMTCEKLGKQAIYASNVGIDGSYAILYADVELKKGQALGFDYMASSELYSDILYVIVNDEDVFQISGVPEEEGWSSCYPCVAEEDGTYEVALCFAKDSDTAAGDDTVYVTNMRIVDASAIDVNTPLPRYAATTEDGETYTYVDVVYNEADGYYHVGTADGPLLLADLMGYTDFAEETTVHDIVYAGDADKDGVSLYEPEGLNMVKYFSYASNSRLNGICTVTYELGEMLKQVAEVAGFYDDPNEWLKICKYFVVYGPGAEQLQDPIIGLAPFNALDATLGKDIDTNYFYYDRPIIPRGLFARFVPAKSGVYRFTSKSDYKDGIDAWIFDANGEILYTYSHDERMYDDSVNCSLVYYMEAGTSYFINMAFWDVYATGRIDYDVEFVAEECLLFRLASPGFFTYDADATGETMYDIIDGGIKPHLKDGCYYAEEGSLIYADFVGVTSLFSHSLQEMIEMGAFDFSQSELDTEILSYMKQNDNDPEKTDAYLRELWGEDYDLYAEQYQIEDVFAGRYHGGGEDYTDEMKAYAKKIDKSNSEKNGCLAVDERLAELLQMLMDKYTFKGVENSWLKLCYYYDYLGPAD